MADGMTADTPSGISVKGPLAFASLLLVTSVGLYSHRILPQSAKEKGSLFAPKLLRADHDDPIGGDRSGDANNDELTFWTARVPEDVVRADPLWTKKVNRRLGQMWLLTLRRRGHAGGDGRELKAVLRLLGPWVPLRARDDVDGGPLALRHISRTFNCSSWTDLGGDGWEPPPSPSMRRGDTALRGAAPGLNTPNIWGAPTVDAIVAEAISYHADQLLGLGTVPAGRLVSLPLGAFARLFAGSLCTSPEALGAHARRVAPGGAARAYGWMQQFVPSLEYLKRPPDVRCELFSKTGDADFGPSFGENFTGDPERRVDPASVARSKLLQGVVGLGDKKGANCFGVPSKKEGFATAAINVDNEYMPFARMPVSGHSAWPNVTWTEKLRPCMHPPAVRAEFIAAVDRLARRHRNSTAAVNADVDPVRSWQDARSPIVRSLRQQIAAEPALAASSSAIRARVMAAFAHWLGGDVRARKRCESWWEGCGCCQQKKKSKHLVRNEKWWPDAVVEDIARQFRTCPE